MNWVYYNTGKKSRVLQLDWPKFELQLCHSQPDNSGKNSCLKVIFLSVKGQHED